MSVAAPTVDSQWRDEPASPHRSPMRYSVTRLGWLLIFIGFILFLSSISSQSSLLLVPIGALIGCYFVNTFAGRRTLKQLRLHAPETVRVVEGQRPDRSWLAENVGGRPIGGISVSTGDKTLFQVPHIEGEDSVHPAPDHRFDRRGVYEHEATIVSTRFPFGLIQVSQTQRLSGRTIVHPDIYHVPPPRAAGFDVMVGGKFRGQRQVASGDSFSGVREHRPGDSLRQIHWPSSAKGLGLMVKNYDEELSGRVAIVLDAGSSGDGEILDHAARLAGSLAYAALDQGHHVELVDLARSEVQIIPPFDDGQMMLDELAEIDATPGCLTAERLHDAVERLSRKAALHVILTDHETAVTDAIEELIANGRKVTVYQTGELPAREPNCQRYAEDGLLP
ncbi:MAG: DUF58 domain-containing protein [Limisphaerales bacterium]